MTTTLGESEIHHKNVKQHPHDADGDYQGVSSVAATPKQRHSPPYLERVKSRNLSVSFERSETTLEKDRVRESKESQPTDVS